MTEPVTPPPQPLVRAALASARIPRALERTSRSALSALWLGVLSEDALGELDEQYYGFETMYHTAEWNEGGLLPWERTLVDERVAPGSRVIVLGCGGGREALALLEDGFDAVGYDPHPALVAYAEELLTAHGHPGRAFVSPRDDFPPGAPPSDAVLVGWGAYTLIRGRATRLRVLAGARDVLPAGAPIILSFLQAPRFGRGLRMTVSVANALRRARGGEPLELGDTLAPNLVHVFTPEQVAGEIAAAGLELVEYRRVGQADMPVAYAAVVARVP
ncbi:MAG TPA: hypothetical protein VJT75_01785 [Thermoleophilaceae bacterium]|nr:hypothetical protein [Thermoleophilaceae bacterium]